MSGNFSKYFFESLISVSVDMFFFEFPIWLHDAEQNSSLRFEVKKKTWNEYDLHFLDTAH